MRYQLSTVTVSMLLAVSFIAAVAAGESTFRIGINGGSVTAFLQEHSAENRVEIVDVTDAEVLSDKTLMTDLDLLLLLGGGGRSDGQLYNARVRDLSEVTSSEQQVVAPLVGGRRGSHAISSQDAAAAERFLQELLDKGTRIVAVPRVYKAVLGRHSEFSDESRLLSDGTLEEYVGRGHVSRENLRRLLGYLSTTYAGNEGAPEPPVPVSITGFYHPDYGDFFPTASAFVSWAKQRGVAVDKAPRALVLANYTHFVSRNQQGIDAILRELTDHGALAACVIVEEPLNQRAMLEFEPDVAIDAFHRGDDIEFRKQLNVVHLHALWLSGRQTIQDWESGVTHIGSMLGVESGEAIGNIEPHVVAGRRAESAGYVPIPDRVERLVTRALSWANLHRKPNANKRIVMLMPGGPGGDLDTPRSLLKLLGRMSAEGFRISDVPWDTEELYSLVERYGSQIDPPESARLDELAKSGKAALIPLASYLGWFQIKVPALQRQEVIARWGAPPGEVMTWTDERGEQFFVVPKIELGNVALVPKPHPWSGDRLNDFNANKQERGSPPSHNILATYFWLEEGYHADAAVVWGTLGADLLARGKAIGVRSSDWPDILMGDLPSIRPFSLGSITFALPAKRRAKAVLVDYLPAPRLSVGLDQELLDLQSDLIKWNRVSPGALRERFRGSITETAIALKLDKDLGVVVPEGELLSEDQLGQLSRVLAEYETERVAPIKHVLGESPPHKIEVSYIVQCLGQGFLDALDEVSPENSSPNQFPGDRRKALLDVAEQAVASVVRHSMSPSKAAESAGIRFDELPQGVEDGLLLAARLHTAFRQSSDELDNIVTALSGGFVPPGASAPPERNPASVPTGRNMYVMNPEEIPTRQSWEVGVGLVDDLLARSLRESGRYPRRIAYTIRTRATMSDFGVSEAQVLYTLGVRPVWSDSGRVTDLEVIPRDKLGRPRIDVFVEPKHHYAEYLESRMRLIDRAVRIIAQLDEPDNQIRANSAEILEELLAGGVDQRQAEVLSMARQFGVAPERFGSGLHDRLFGATGVWENEDQLADVYAHQHAFAYTEGAWGMENADAFRRQLSSTDVVVRSMSRGSALSGRAAYSGGMLALATERLSGQRPKYYLADLRNPGAERLSTASEAVRRALRTELLNNKWIETKMANERSGAFAISAMVGRVLDWRITTPESIDEDTWRQLADVYLNDAKVVGLAEWFENGHQEAYRSLLESLLEAVRKGYWNADDEMVRSIARRHARLNDSPPSGNVALLEFVASLAAATPEAPPMSGSASPSRPESQAPASPELAASKSERSSEQDSLNVGELVEGRRLVPAPQDANAESDRVGWWIIGLLGIIMAIGAWLRVGMPRSR